MCLLDSQKRCGCVVARRASSWLACWTSKLTALFVCDTQNNCLQTIRHATSLLLFAKHTDCVCVGFGHQTVDFFGKHTAVCLCAQQTHKHCLPPREYAQLQVDMFVCVASTRSYSSIDLCSTWPSILAKSLATAVLVSQMS